MKNNLGPDSTGLAFRIEGVNVPSPAGLLLTSRVAWDSEPIPMTADEAMQAEANSSRTSAVQEVTDWLRGISGVGVRTMTVRNSIQEGWKPAKSSRMRTLSPAWRNLLMYAARPNEPLSKGKLHAHELNAGIEPTVSVPPVALVVKDPPVDEAATAFTRLMLTVPRVMAGVMETVATTPSEMAVVFTPEARH
jgi:hypothetical protein